MSRIAILFISLSYGILVASGNASRAQSAHDSELSARKDAWQQRLEHQKFLFPESYWGLMVSLREHNADCQLHIVFDPKDKWTMEYRFVRDGKQTLSLKGHTGPAFTSHENVLYFADFSLDSMGCNVSAYDLDSGERIWETTLAHEKPGGHSAYRNLVLIRMSRKNEVIDEAEGSSVIVTGRESYCDYVEVLDAKTGEMLALKNYRVGF